MNKNQILYKCVYGWEVYYSPDENNFAALKGQYQHKTKRWFAEKMGWKIEELENNQINH